MRLIFDLESNALLDAVTTIHCIVTKDADTGTITRYRSTDGSIEAALQALSQADELIGHNILSYDLPALQKVYPSFTYKAKIFDTLVCSRLIWTNLLDIDFKTKIVPKPLRGLHKLEAWGFRLGERKGLFGKQTGDGEVDAKVWEHWSQDMEDYCQQDVVVTEKLYRKIQEKGYAELAIWIEHAFRELIDKQERHGFRFNEAKATELMVELQKKRIEITESLQSVFPPRQETLKTPAFWSVNPSDPASPRYPTKKAAAQAGAKVKLLKAGPLKVKEIPFNPGSRQQIVSRLKEAHGWEPKEFTDSDEPKPKVSEEILEGFDWPEAKVLCDYFVVQKTLGMLSDGDNGCLRLVKNGYIHGRVNTGGAVTGRCTHSKPNVAQTPSVAVRKVDGKKVALRGLEGRYGYDFRDLYLPDDGHVLVGWDASGLELRCLAHYLARYDDGAFGKLVTDGDPHTANQNAAGLYLRDSAKTFIYAYMYGAGDEKLGTIAIQDAIAAKQPKPKGSLRGIGKRLRARFETNFSALKRLRTGIKATCQQRGWLNGLDGRRLHIRSQYAALNTLLQSCGAVLMKRAAIIQYDILTKEHGLMWGRDFVFVANIHDELQISVKPEFAELVGKTGPEALRRSGELFDFKCRLDGEYKIGNSWAETH